MSSYGDHNAGYGRAQVPSDGYGYEYDDHEETPPPPRRDAGQWPDNGGGYGSGGYGPGGYGDGSYDGGYPPQGGPGVGSPPVGRASVGRATVSGSASVPTAGGRARVRPAGPDDDFDDLDETGGPGGPAGPGRRSRKGGDGGPPKSAKKRKRRKILLASFAALIILIGTSAIAGTYMFDSVSAIEPENLPNKQTTAVYASDGKTQLAQLGTENRVQIDVTKLSPEVQHALIAGEDKNFYNHHGVDFAGIARAAWNNITSDETQGASTITQQYVKFATEKMDISYGRKIREAVLARKLEDTHTKEQILGYYLNTIPFGRGAIGVEKASMAYFGHGADKLTVEEAAILGSVIRQPYGEGGTGSPYDPEVNPTEAEKRWNYVMDNMVLANWLDQGSRGSKAYPKICAGTRPAGGCWIKKTATNSAKWGVNGPGPSGLVTGNVLNYVYKELEAFGIDSNMVDTEGYRITTSIDPKMQKAAEAAARRGVKGSVISTMPSNVMGALVAINPANGRVIAYYGGDQGTGIDYAGRNTEGGVETGGHPPGSSMKVYTLTAALEANYSLQSRWLAMPGKYGPYTVQNAGRKDTTCQDYCTLEESLIQSYNVPFFQVTQTIGVDKVVQAAKAAGITMIWGQDAKGNRVAVDIEHKKDFSDIRQFVDLPVGFGQYGITVIDHASGLATIANGGNYIKPHFVVGVQKRQPDGTYKAVPGAAEKIKPDQRIPAAVAADVTYAMEKVTESHHWSIDGGRETAAKTGTWELNSKSADNAHAWVVGFTKQIAVAVWVGNAGAEKALRYKNGTKINSGNAPADIWKKFLNAAVKGQPRQSFSGPANIGSDDGGTGVSPSPSQPGDGGFCLPLLPCPDPSNGNGGGGNGNGNGGGLPQPSTTPSTKPGG